MVISYKEKAPPKIKKKKMITNKLIRNALRVPSWILLIFMSIMRIVVPTYKGERLILDINDGYVMLGCIALLLSIEAIKAGVDYFIKNRLK